MKSLFAFLAVLSLVSLTAFTTVRTVIGVNFDRNCAGYLERAAHANTVALAIPALEKGIAYLTVNNLTEGYTSVAYRTPDEDIGFFYTNLNQSLAELKSLKPDASALEASNVLMKLRETLIVNGEKGGESLRCPDGISIYGSNTIFAIWGWASLIGLGLGILMWFVADFHSYR